MFVAFALLATALPALAWNNSSQYLTGLGQALQNAGLTTLGSQTGRLNNSVIGRILLARLVLGNYTLFAPDNEAFANATNSSSILNDDNLFALTILYHIVSGNFSPTSGGNGTNATLEAATYPNVTIGRTLLDDPSVVQLEGNKSQVLVWSNIDGQVEMYNQPFLDLATVTAPDGTNESITALLDGDSVHGFTFFAPDNAAIELENSSLTSTCCQPDSLTLHLEQSFNGTTMYSPEITASENLTSAGGEPLTFTTNSSGTFVNSGTSSARIIKTDILCKNGVLHMLDRVLINTETNPEAATSAYVCPWPTIDGFLALTFTSDMNPPLPWLSVRLLRQDQSAPQRSLLMGLDKCFLIALKGVLAGVTDNTNAMFAALLGVMGWALLGITLV
ncbi:hypothetical protein F5146DRAFT_1162487 [Armillaria mellea]|nr:hypothetical protein F5146DRAFT_1162487 [Armillaria mellea]